MDGLAGLFGGFGQDVSGIAPTYAQGAQPNYLQKMSQGLQAMGQSGMQGTNIIPIVMALRNAGFKNQYGVGMQQMAAPVSDATISPINQ